MAEPKSTPPNLVCLTQEEWRELEECTQAWTGVVRLFQSGDTEEGGEQLLYTVHKRYDDAMARIQNRLHTEGPVPTEDE